MGTFQHWNSIIDAALKIIPGFYGEENLLSG